MIRLKNILSELHEPGHEEGKMAKAQAYELMKDAEDVCRMIGEGDNLPEWLEAKITLASDYMNKVKDYLSNYEMKGMHEGVLNEGFSINGLVKMVGKARKEKEAALERWLKFDQKWDNAKVTFRNTLDDLSSQRDEIMREMENDPDVLQNHTVGHKGAVANYAKQLHKVELKQRKMEAKWQFHEKIVKEAKLEYEQLKRKELKLDDTLMSALKKGAR